MRDLKYAATTRGWRRRGGKAGKSESIRRWKGNALLTWDAITTLSHLTQRAQWWHNPISEYIWWYIVTWIYWLMLPWAAPSLKCTVLGLTLSPLVRVAQEKLTLRVNVPSGVVGMQNVLRLLKGCLPLIQWGCHVSMSDAWVKNKWAHTFGLMS